MINNVNKWLIMVNKINNDFSQEPPCLRFEWVLNTPVSVFVITEVYSSCMRGEVDVD